MSKTKKTFIYRAFIPMLCVLASCSSDGGSSDKPSSTSTATVSLGCQLQKTVEKGGTIEIPDLICNNGRTATRVIWNGRPGDNTTWKVATNSTLDSYTISVTATCGSVYIEDQPCGTVKVKTASSSSGGAGSSSSTGGGSSSSVVPLTCTLQSTTVVRGSTIPTPTLTCGNGETATSPNWNGRPQTNTTWEVDANGVTNSYTITVSAICGTDTERIPAVSCGTVNVVDAGSSSSTGSGSSSSTGGDSSSSVGGGSSSSTGGDSSSSVGGESSSSTGSSSSSSVGGESSSSKGGESSSSTGSSSSSSSVATSDNQTFTDTRDNQTYKFVKIGEQTWMAQDLNYRGTEPDILGECFDQTCDKRLYNWATAMGFEASCNSSSCVSQQKTPNHQGICPDKWHIPTKEEWQALVDFVAVDVTVNGENVCTERDKNKCKNVGTRLKAESGWMELKGANGNGTDDYGFAALPNRSFTNNISGNFGYWWGTEYYNQYAPDDSKTNAVYMNITSGNILGEIYYVDRLYKAGTYGVRCLKD